MIYCLKKPFFYTFVALLLFLSGQLASQEKELNLIISTLKKSNNEQVQVNMLKGIVDGLKGVNKLPAPATNIATL